MAAAGSGARLRLLVSDRIHPAGLGLLRERFEVDERPGIPTEELARLLPEFDILLMRAIRPLTAAMLAAAPRLKILAIASIGTDTVDVAAARARGIVVFNAPGLSAPSVAEFTIGQMLALSRRSCAADAAVRAGGWQRPDLYGIELAGRTAGIVGLGAVGGRVARLCLAFGMQVLACDPYVRIVLDAGLGESTAVRLVDLDTLLRESHFVTLHCPLTEETRGLIGAAELARMRRDAYLLNMARGPVVDEEALARALREGAIAGAAVDVFAEEPPRRSPLLDAPNCLLSPHIAGVTEEAQARISRAMAARILEEADRL